MEFQQSMEQLVNSRKCLSYFQQKNLVYTKPSLKIPKELWVARISSKHMADLGEYVYYFMKEGDALVIWSDSARLINFSISANGNSLVPSLVMAPPFFIVLNYETMLTLFTKGFTTPDSLQDDSLLITTTNQLLYRSYTGNEVRVDMVYYYMDRRSNK